VAVYPTRVPVDLEAQGLLEGLDTPAEREARTALVNGLLDDGVPITELKRAATEGRLVLMAVERALRVPGETYTVADVAAQTRLSEAGVRRLRASFGLTVPADGERTLNADDVQEGRRLNEALSLGFHEERVLRLNRVIGQRTAQIAAAMVEATVETMLQPGDTEHDLARRVADAGTALLPMAGSVVAYAVQEHLREQLGRAAITRAELLSGRPVGVRSVSVCFADLVGFTDLAERIAPEQLGAVAERLASIAAELAVPPVTLVKTIGDAAMLVCQDPQPLLDAARALLSAADSEATGFPALRVGIAEGRALFHAGDWFGQPVNLASRICARAAPGEILATTQVAQACPEAHWVPAGTHELKGLGEPVELWRCVQRRQGG
jgi:adenylate cyclase